MASEVENQIKKLKELGATVKIESFSKNDKITVKMPDFCLDDSFQLGINGRVGDEGRSLLLDTAIKEIEEAAT